MEISHLGAALGAVGAPDVLDVAAAVLVAPAVPPLERLQHTANNGEATQTTATRSVGRRDLRRRSLPWLRQGGEAPGRGSAQGGSRVAAAAWVRRRRWCEV
jgi:hypothetical protein